MVKHRGGFLFLLSAMREWRVGCLPQLSFVQFGDASLCLFHIYCRVYDECFVCNF